MSLLSLEQEGELKKSGELFTSIVEDNDHNLNLSLGVVRTCFGGTRLAARAYRNMYYFQVDFYP